MKQFWAFIFWSISISGMAQNVGIGTSSPQKKLHVVSADSIALQIEGADLSSNTAAVGISLRPTNNVSFQWLALRGRDDAFVINSARLYLNRKYDNETRTVMFIDEYGQVGIGGTEANLIYPTPSKLNILQNGLSGNGIYLEAPYLYDGLIIRGLSSNLYPNPSAQKISAIRFDYDLSYNSRITLENLTPSPNPRMNIEMYNPATYDYEKVLSFSPLNATVKKFLFVEEGLSVYKNLDVYGTINTGIVRPFVDVDMPTNFISEIFCACPSGYKAIGGGGGHRDYNTAAQDIKINYSGPDPNPANDFRWKVIATNTNTTQLRAVRVYAICARMQ